MKDEIKIVDAKPEHYQAFRDINVQWIKRYFIMEEADYVALNNPKEYIIDKGGFMLIALLNEKPVGVAALIKMEDSDYDYELAKMGVLPETQGRGVGNLLMQAIIDKAKNLNTKKLYLESNRILGPAIHLYKKYGFEEVYGRKSPYERSDILMECVIKGRS